MKTLQYYRDLYNLDDCPEAGYEIGRNKDLLFTHTGLPVGKDRTTGELMIVDNHIKRGVTLVPYSVYEDDKACGFTGREQDDRETVLIRAFEEIGQKYNVFQNCQAFTSYCRVGKGKSFAVKNISDVLTYGGGTLAVIGASSRNKRATGWGMAFLALGVLGKILDNHEESKRIQSRVKSNFF